MDRLRISLDAKSRLVPDRSRYFSQKMIAQAIAYELMETATCLGVEEPYAIVLIQGQRLPGDLLLDNPTVTIAAE